MAKHSVAFKHAGKSITLWESNGQWRRDVWITRLKKQQSFYFGTVADDPEGTAAMYDPSFGYIARAVAIQSGLDKAGVVKPEIQISVGTLMNLFMGYCEEQLVSGNLAPETYKGYREALSDFGEWRRLAEADAAAVATSPQVFADYLAHLALPPTAAVPGNRGLGLDRQSVECRYIRRLFNWGAMVGKTPLPKFGTMAPPSATPDAKALWAERMGKQGKRKSGEPHIFKPAEMVWLLERATPLFRAMILMAVNCGLGPKDLGRLRWTQLDLDRNMLDSRRGKAGGARREAFLWPETVEALRRVRTLKHCAAAIAKDGEDAFVFLTRKNVPVVRAENVMKGGRVVDVKLFNAVTQTFGKWVREGQAQGKLPPDKKIAFYYLRHTFRTLAEGAKDTNALLRVMGRKLTGTCRTDARYIHGSLGRRRIAKVCLRVRRRLMPDAPKFWPFSKRTGQTDTAPPTTTPTVPQSAADVAGVAKVA